MSTWRSRPGGVLRGVVRVPGDKSISHRSIMFAALADGTSTIRGFLEGEDTRATAAAFAAMGVRIESPEPGVRVVHGVGIDGLRAPGQDIDCGNAGTGMRLLAGVLAGQPFGSRLIGDASLSRRPMRRVTEPLGLMGARIDTASGAMPPLQVHGGRALQGIHYSTPMASAPTNQMSAVSHQAAPTASDLFLAFSASDTAQASASIVSGRAIMWACKSP